MPAPRPASCAPPNASTPRSRSPATAPTVNGNSIMGLMMLGAGPGSTILVQASGKQAREALDAITVLVKNGFDEDSEGAAAGVTEPIRIQPYDPAWPAPFERER